MLRYNDIAVCCNGVNSHLSTYNEKQFLLQKNQNQKRNKLVNMVNENLHVA